ncbi:hypothetical protein [Treponema sp.]|uniref:hypothetical protein n=1 Tax=Treponema sp. TaxID=166 RepID=UPI00298DB58B|nr:hypothetical protein [Treponema sp.]MCR5613591.1 hypothetical protein [Treponema sp.]
MNCSGFRYLIFFIVCFICFCGCSKKSVCYSGTADEIINYYKENDSLNFNKGDLIEVEGVIEHISYPIDGFKTNECVVYLGTEGCNVKRLEGNYMSCKFNYQLDQNYIGKKVKVKGVYKRIYILPNGMTVRIEKCEITDCIHD